MNRRELLSTSASGLAGAVLLGAAPELSIVAGASTGWKEDALTKKLQGLITPPVEAVKKAKSIYAISAQDWKDLSTNHGAWGDQHSRLGNTHLLDLYAQTHQPALRKKYGDKAVNRMLKLGVHQCWTQDAGGVGWVGEALSDGKFRLGPEECTGLVIYEADSAILGLMFAGMGLEPLGFLFGALGVSLLLAHFALCG